MIFRAAFRKSSSLLKLKQGIALMENGKPNALFHILEWVCVHERCTSHLPKQSQFIYLCAIGVTKSRDSPFSSIGLITSGNLKRFTDFFQGLQSYIGTDTRDSCEHPKCSQVAWRGHHIPQHYPGALWFICLGEVRYTNKFPRLTMIFMEIFGTRFSSRHHRQGIWSSKAQLLFATTIFVPTEQGSKKKPWN